jgi:hypothetical protein
MQTPNTKHQTPDKHQAPNTNSHAGRCWASGLKFDVWDLFGVWCLVFGASLGVSFEIA